MIDDKAITTLFFKCTILNNIAAQLIPTAKIHAFLRNMLNKSNALTLFVNISKIIAKIFYAFLFVTVYPLIMMALKNAYKL